MWWLTWRQHRAQVLALSAAVAVFGAYLVHRAWPMVEPTRLLHACAAGRITDGRCDEPLVRNGGVDSGLMITLAAANLIPALVGAFWGAPLLAREFERGTHRLAWGQSVTRRRWLAVKLAGLGGAAALLGVAASALLTWVTDQFMVMGTIDRFRDRMLFDIVGVAPPALWLFALVLGVTVGMFVRRTLAAMAVTLVLFGAALLGLNAVRPHYATPETRPAHPGWEGNEVFQSLLDEEWVVGHRLRRADGRTVATATGRRLCPGGAPPESEIWNQECLAAHGIDLLEVYHPDRRYWRFQWTEAGIVLTATALLAGFILIRIHRRAD